MMDSSKILNLVDKMMEFYCLGFENNNNDDNDFILEQIINGDINYEDYIAVCFVGEREKQYIRKIDDFKKSCLFIKIYYKSNDIKILVKKNNIDKLSQSQILNLINSNKFMKNPIRYNLKINIFPLNNYILIENKNIKEKNFDEIYNLYEISQNNNFDNSYLNQNSIIFPYNLEINSKEQKINELEKLLNEEKNKNKELNLKIKDLESNLIQVRNHNSELKIRIRNLEETYLNKNNNRNIIEKEKLSEIINKNNIEINELRKKLSRYPFELLEGEKMISIIFNSGKQDIINFPIICKNTDIFVNIELKLYEKYPNYSENENFFTTSGKRINRYKSLENNKIENGSIILIEPIE